MTTIAKIKSILDRRTFDELIGLKEDPWFDAKVNPPYELSTAVGRIELAKDVSGFANSQGGYLIIGLDTEVVVAEKTEEVSAVTLVNQAEFNLSQYTGLIRDHVFPEIIGLTVEWAESTIEAGKGLGVIWIPPQEEPKKYFLMSRVIEDGQQLKQIVFGVARRVGSSTEPFTVQQVYTLTQQGKSDNAQRLTRIEGKIDSVMHAISAPKSTQPLAPAEVDKMIQKLRES